MRKRSITVRLFVYFCVGVAVSFLVCASAFAQSCMTSGDCTSSNKCQVGTCVAGQCSYAPKICNDNNACTSDSCDPNSGTCIFTPINCDDNNACTVDRCDATVGACTRR